MNSVVLIGRLSKDVELRYLPVSGTAVANFSLVVDREFSKDGKKEVDFIDIQVWGKSAENCANYLSKGSQAAVKGSIRQDKYQGQEGKNRYSFKVNADRVQFLNTKSNGKNKGLELQGLELQWLEPQGFQQIDDDDIPF